MTADQHAGILAAFDARVPKHEIARRFACSRKMIAILVEARAAGRTVKPRPGPANQHKRWSSQDLQRLVVLWGTCSTEDVAAALKRSPLTVYYKAGELGLKRGMQQGVEHLSAAARRAGLSRDSLRSVLRRARCQEHEGRMSKPSSKPRRFVLLDPADVDDAVTAWTQEEIVNVAGRRHDICGETLRAWLIAEGHRPPRKRKAPWRLASSVIDAVVAKHKRMMSISAHARRIGVDRWTLADRLRAAGVLKVKRPGGATLVSIDAVDGALRRSA